ncbi:MAG: hypothetical protein NC928_05750 [Candidatus Omnitrophica bacterium]|nr:hypothetical protein [Candidatus Omnitrophota bacterium]
MQDEMEKLTQVVFKYWQKRSYKQQQLHPDTEEIASFLEGKLSAQDAGRIKEHLAVCDLCLETVVIQIKLMDTPPEDLPKELVAWAQALVKNKETKETSFLEILLALKEEAIEIIRATGDVLVGQEFVPAVVLRSRKIKEFKDEITILKDFAKVRVEARIENQRGKAFNLTVVIKDKKTQALMKDLRVTLLKDDTELESYIVDSGSVTFEHVDIGRYTVNISSLEENVASILLDIKL